MDKRSEPVEQIDGQAAQRVSAGGKIGAAGVYDLSFEEYFSDCCIGHSVSGTGLKVIERKTLRHYWWQSYLNPDRPEIDTNALRFGRAVHSWVLGLPDFEQYFVVAPYEEFNKNPGKKWHTGWKERVESGEERRTLVRPSQLDAIKTMAGTLKDHPLLRNVFTDGAPERSIVYKDAETGIWIKTRPDWLPNASQFVPDLKTTKSAKPDDFARDALTKFNYHQSAALAIDGLRTVLGWKNPTYYFVAQEKEPPYVVMPFVIRDADIEWGAMLNRRALRKLADALSADKWPAYADGAVEIAMPAWNEKLLQDQNERGEFADEQEQAA